MLTRRHSILLTVKGLAALVASGSFLSGCGDGVSASPSPSGDGAGGAGDAGAQPTMDAGMAGGRIEDTLRARTSPDTTSGGPGRVEDAAGEERRGEDALSRSDDAGPVEAGNAADAPMDWASFIVALSALADAQFSNDWEQADYVEEVAALMKLLDLDDAYFQTLYDGYVEVLGTFPELATVHEGGHFEVATLEFDAGDEIPLHNHPDMTGVILCLTGKMNVEGFDLLDELSPDGNLLLERVENLTLVAGDHCTLTADRGNIHSVVALEFTQLLDVFTPPYDDEKLLRYRWYERDLSPYEGEDIFEAWETS
jgi:predicted metal-dependent enzyme (double-stranded beta helix superfamily)